MVKVQIHRVHCKLPTACYLFLRRWETSTLINLIQNMKSNMSIVTNSPFFFVDFFRSSFFIFVDFHQFLTLLLHPASTRVNLDENDLETKIIVFSFFFFFFSILWRILHFKHFSYTSLRKFVLRIFELWKFGERMI